MSEILTDSPNTTSAAPIQNPVSDESLFAKMTAMRNQQQPAEQTGTGDTGKAETESPVAPEEVSESDTSSVEPEVVTPEEEETESQEQTENAPQDDEVSTENSTAEDVIDFIQFATENPNAKFKFVRNGKEMIIDAKQAQAILGQGGAIHEEARQLKIQKAEFDDYLKSTKETTTGLMLAMEFVVEPKLKQAYDEVIKVQGYQAEFNKRLQEPEVANDPATVARIVAAINQNEAWLQQQTQTIAELKPNVELFRSVRRDNLNREMEAARKSFTDKELRNEYIYNELREKVSKNWSAAKQEIVPGVPNIDLISSDEYIFGLIRDGLKYREKPSVKSAGNSIAALTPKKSAAPKTPGSNIEQLREQAKQGDKKAQDNLLVAQLNMLRQARNGKK